jgi:hypothetical protein
MLINFLTDVISNMESFRDDITTVYLYHEGDNLVATGNHPKRMLFYKVTPLSPMAELLEAPAYLGALGYLRSLLASSMMKENATIQISYKENDGKKLCVEGLRFLAKRFESQFQCTNPNILNEKDRVKQFPRPNDAIFFSFDKQMRKDFEEVAKFNTPKADTRLFTLSYDGSYVRAIFGSGSHTSNFIMTNEISGHTDTKFTKLISLDRFRAMGKLAADNDNARVGYHPNAIWVDFDTPYSLHTIVTPTIREQSR